MKLIYPEVAFSPTSIAFGSGGVVGSFAGNQFLNVHNAGNAPLLIQSIAFGGASPGDFSYDHDGGCTAPVAPKSSCQLDINFNPQAPGSRSGTLILATTGTDTPETVALTGSAVTPANAMPSATSLDFGTHPAGSASASQTVTITNTGGSILYFGFGSIEFVGAGFEIVSDTCGNSPGLASGASCSLTIAFAPPYTGTFTER